MSRIGGIVLVLMLVTAACAGGDDLSAEATPATTSATTAPADVAAARALSTPSNTVPGRFDPAAQPLDPDEVPQEIISTVLEDAGGRPDNSAYEVLLAETQIWSDGSLGCPEPGVSYTQALVDGYQVIISGPTGDQDYRIAANGYFFICTQTN